MFILRKYYKLTKEERESLLAKLTEALKKMEGVRVAYLFGSLSQERSQGSPTPKAFGLEVKDVDVAILMDEQNASPRLRVEEAIRSKLAPLTSPLPVDVVLLNGATPLFRHEVIKTGKTLFARDREESLQFEVSSENEYFDFEPIRNLFWAVTEKRLSEGSFGYEFTDARSGLSDKYRSL